MSLLILMFVDLLSHTSEPHGKHISTLTQNIPKYTDISPCVAIHQVHLCLSDKPLVKRIQQTVPFLHSALQPHTNKIMVHQEKKPFLLSRHSDNVYFKRNITWGIISCNGIKIQCLMAGGNASPVWALRAHIRSRLIMCLNSLRKHGLLLAESPSSQSCCNLINI